MAMPNLKFLQKVKDGHVRLSFSYSSRKGGNYNFRGGEATAKKHAVAGFITMPGAASLGRPSFAKLTEKGVAALEGTQS